MNKKDSTQEQQKTKEYPPEVTQTAAEVLELVKDGENLPGLMDSDPRLEELPMDIKKKIFESLKNFKSERQHLEKMKEQMEKETDPVKQALWRRWNAGLPIPDEIEAIMMENRGLSENQLDKISKWVIEQGKKQKQPTDDMEMAIEKKKLYDKYQGKIIDVRGLYRIFRERFGQNYEGNEKWNWELFENTVHMMDWFDSRERMEQVVREGWAADIVKINKGKSIMEGTGGMKKLGEDILKGKRFLSVLNEEDGHWYLILEDRLVEALGKEEKKPKKK